MTDAHAIATEFYETIGRAWNAADGPGFGAPFSATTSFVDIRGVRHVGGPAEIGGSHQGIFDSIYKGSSIRYELETARALDDQVVLAHGRATLDAPSGPLAGTSQAVSTVVLVHEEGAWRAASFHNTLVTS